MRALALAVVVLVPLAARARSSGIETLSCNGCHGTGSQQTSITLEPTTFNPGDTITVHVRIAGSGAVGGLYLTSNGAGAFSLVSGQSTRLSGGSVVHSSPKPIANGAVTFDVKWKAPGSPGGVTFEVATVLANGNGSSGGDQSSYATLSTPFGCAGTTYYRDADGDGVGSTGSGTTVNCAPPEGYSALDGDCDDFDNRKTPGKTEACNGVDDNCDGNVDEGLTSTTTWPDSDGDGYGWTLGAPTSGCAGGNRAANDGDCDDVNPTINPGATEVCNQKDDDCDGQIDENAKVRCGVGWCARFGPTCDVADCTPGAPVLERCDGLDDDCDGQVDEGDLCESGGSCVAGKCVYDSMEDAGAAPVDAGTLQMRDDDPMPSPVGASCSAGPGMLALLTLALFRRRASL